MSEQKDENDDSADHESQLNEKERRWLQNERERKAVVAAKLTGDRTQQRQL